MKTNDLRAENAIEAALVIWVRYRGPEGASLPMREYGDEMAFSKWGTQSYTERIPTIRRIKHCIYELHEYHDVVR